MSLKSNIKNNCNCFIINTIIFYLFIISVIIYTLISIVTSVPALNANQLYINNNEINVLNDNNFSSSVYKNKHNSNRIQLIQFYNSWCGHCIAFAPIFKQFSSDIKYWFPLVSVSVVDCAEDINTKICRDMDINVYPTIKMFWFNLKDQDTGQELKSFDRTADGVRNAVIQWTVDNWSKGVPRFWPDLMPISALSKDQLIKSLPIEKGIPIIIVVEDEKSYIGREIILDMFPYQKSVIVLRMLDSSESLLNQILPQTLNHYTRPFLLRIDNKDYKFKFFSMPVYKDKQLREMFVKLIKKEFVSEEDILSVDKHFTENIAKEVIVKKISDQSAQITDNIYMSDLNNALRYSLFQEIALKKKLNSTQLNALKSYLTVIELHFPFQTDKMRTFIKYLNDWLLKKPNGDVYMDDMLTTMKIYEDYYHFPEMKKWKGCAGSNGKYRGYPCSLWTLFHTLTVREYKNTLKTQKWSTLHSVLYSMRDYVKYFFGCTYCAKHFEEMAKNLETELIYPNSSVLWLWKAHNKANLRLKGDPSEDPQHPKVLFPTENHCSNCYEANLEFNEKSVFDYLLKHYSNDNIIRDKTENTNEIVISDKPEKVISKNYFTSDTAIDSSFRSKLNYNLLNGTDYSLIMLLYFSSAALILGLCVYLKIRVRKRGQKFNSLKNSYA